MQKGYAMDHDRRGRQLHDRATRGEVLSPEEQTELEAWYEAQDRAEATILRDGRDDASTAALQAQVAASVRRVQAVTQQLADLVAENDRLRREVVAAQQRLAQMDVARSA